MKKHITFALLFAAALTAQAQQGGISGEMLNQIKQSYKATPADKAIRNALGGTSINTLALNQENRADFDTEFSHKVLSPVCALSRDPADHIEHCLRILRHFIFCDLILFRSMIWSGKINLCKRMCLIDPG